MDNVMEKLVSLTKRRGYVYPSSEIYGGINACWDYGPLGTVLKQNVKAEWWRAMTQLRDDVEPLDAAILMHPRVWEASGHVEHFTDPLIDCRECKARFRADEDLFKGDPKDPNTPCPRCGNRGTLTDPRRFNLMFKTFMGPVEDDASVVFLRPETAQGIYVNYQNVQTTARRKLPFGIAQIGKAFRNEITPGNFIFRTREFEQMEMQYFVKPGDDEKWMDYWREQRFQWYLDIGIRRENLRWHEHGPGELAHYAKTAFDIEYEFPFGWKELEGVHNRTNYDLGKHQEYSGKKLEYFDDATKERFIPFIVETSAGCDRTLLTVLVDAYREDEIEGEKRTLLSLHPRLAPVKVAVFPLVKRDNMPEIAKSICGDLRKSFPVFYDEAGAIGRRYRRQDEAGTPFCVTVDSQTLEDETVTIRFRDSLEQERAKIADLTGRLTRLVRD